MEESDACLPVQVRDGVKEELKTPRSEDECFVDDSASVTSGRHEKEGENFVNDSALPAEAKEGFELADVEFIDRENRNIEKEKIEYKSEQLVDDYRTERRDKKGEECLNSVEVESIANNDLETEDEKRQPETKDRLLVVDSLTEPSDKKAEESLNTVEPEYVANDDMETVNEKRDFEPEDMLVDDSLTEPRDKKAEESLETFEAEHIANSDMDTENEKIEPDPEDRLLVDDSLTKPCDKKAEGSLETLEAECIAKNHMEIENEKREPEPENRLLVDDSLTEPFDKMAEGSLETVEAESIANNDMETENEKREPEPEDRLLVDSLTNPYVNKAEESLETVEAEVIANNDMETEKEKIEPEPENRLLGDDSLTKPCDKKLVEGLEIVEITNNLMETENEKRQPEPEDKLLVGDSTREPYTIEALEVLENVDVEPVAEKDGNTEKEKIKPKRDHEWLVDDSGMEPCAKRAKKGHVEEESIARKNVKEGANDDIISEVSNPNLSPQDNVSSFRAVNSHSVVDSARIDGVTCGELTSSSCSKSCSSSSEGSTSDGVADMDNTAPSTFTTCVVREIPEHVSTTGVRKITFRFSKPREEYDNQLRTSAAHPPSEAFDNRVSRGPGLMPSAVNDHIRQGLWSADPFLDPTRTNGMMSEGVLAGYLTNVRKLLSTGILEGAGVRYVDLSRDLELYGIVRESGYLCGCSSCNLSNILSAHEFEEHAGGSTKHPNGHIVLENGRPIYSIVQELRTASLSDIEEVVRNIAGSSVNEEYLHAWIAELQRKSYVAKPGRSSYIKQPNMNRSTISCSSEETEDNCSPSSGSYVKDIHFKSPGFWEMQKQCKPVVKRPRFVEQNRRFGSSQKKRDNDLHRLLFMPNGLPDGTELGYYARGKKILGGFKQGNGIVCNHCDTEISPSLFEAHAGCAAKRQPYRHIYTSSGETLHGIALALASGQSIATANSGDTCAGCGDGGELINCNGCHRAFHSGGSCLGLEHVTSEDWLCPYCTENLRPKQSKPLVVRLNRVVKVPESDVRGGCVICRGLDFVEDGKFDERVMILCDQCEKEHHIGCLKEKGICDLKELPNPEEKWFCCEHCSRIYSVLQEMVCRTELVPASVLSALNKKHFEKGLTGRTRSDIFWRILSGKSRIPEHQTLLSRAAAIFRECFDPIVAESGRDLIPLMVYGRNISGQEFGGMHCVVLIVGSVVVSAGLIRIFGREVAEVPMVATRRQQQGKGYFQALFSCIENLLLSLDVETLVLPAAVEAESIWTNKLGFRRMSDERYFKLAKDFQLTIFRGTSMLEKDMRNESY